MKYYVRVWLKNIHQYYNFEKLTKAEALSVCEREVRKSRKPIIFQHKT